MGAKLFEMIFQSKPAEEILQEIKELTKKVQYLLTLRIFNNFWILDHFLQDWPQCLAGDEYTATCKLLLSLYLLNDYQSHVKNSILRYILIWCSE
jgi:hypothetical protein